MQDEWGSTFRAKIHGHVFNIREYQPYEVHIGERLRSREAM